MIKNTILLMSLCLSFVLCTMEEKVTIKVSKEEWEKIQKIIQQLDTPQSQFITDKHHLLVLARTIQPNNVQIPPFNGKALLKALQREEDKNDEQPR